MKKTLHLKNSELKLLGSSATSRIPKKPKISRFVHVKMFVKNVTGINCSTRYLTTTGRSYGFSVRSASPFPARNFHVKEFLAEMTVRTARNAKNPPGFRATANNTQSVTRPFLARRRPPYSANMPVIDFFVMRNVFMVTYSY